MTRPLFRNLFFLIIFIIISPSLLSQSNFIPGYLITNQNDTLFGLVDSRSNAKNSKICRFKTETDSKISEYKPFEIKAYRFINEGRFYVSYSVISDGIAKEIFAEYLLNGMVDLYFYQDSEPHFLLQNTSGEVYELKNGQSQSASPENKTPQFRSNNYIGLLKACFIDQPSLYNDIDVMRLSQSNLVDISVRYHDLSCTGEKCIVYSKPPPPVSFETSVFFGPDFRIASLSGTGGTITLGEYKYKSGFRAGILSSITSPYLNDRFFLQVGFSLFQSHLTARNLTPNRASQVISDMTLKGSSLSLNTVYRYPRGKWRPFASAGISFSSFKVATEFQYLVIDYNYIEDWSYSQNLKGAFGFNGSFGCSYLGLKKLNLSLTANYENTSAVYIIPASTRPLSNGPFYLKGLATYFSVGYTFR